MFKILLFSYLSPFIAFGYLITLARLGYRVGKELVGGTVIVRPRNRWSIRI